jgi:hypothetical protein
MYSARRVDVLPRLGAVSGTLKHLICTSKISEIM